MREKLLSPTLETLYQRFKQETRSWFGLFGLIFGVFILTVSITNIARQFLSFQLLPIFENSFVGIHSFVSYVVGNTVFRLIELAVEVTEKVMQSLFLVAFNFDLPELNFRMPSWLSDLSIVSVVLLRAQTQAMQYSNPSSTLTMKRSEKIEWEWAIMNCRQPLKGAINVSWWIVLVLYRVKKFVEWPFQKMNLERTARTIGLFVGGSTFLGLAYFLHDALSIPATNHLNSDHAHSHRLFFAWTLASLLAALLASSLFILWNGLLLT